MSLRRVLSVFRLELAFQRQRPLVWVLIILLALFAYGFATGGARISSGDSDVGGMKAWANSEFSFGVMLTLFAFLIYPFFTAIAAGMAVIRDEESRIEALLHSTPLRASEYVWGKFLAILAAFLAVLVIELGFHAIAYQWLTGADRAEYTGPFVLTNYLRPALYFVVPMIVLISGTAFAIGSTTRKPILVFVLPIALFLASVFFLLDWSPHWLPPQVETLLGCIEPSGWRWLNETWMKVDRGAAFYNHGAIGLDWPFVTSRLAFMVIGLASVAYSARRLDATLRGRMSARARKAREPQAFDLAPAHVTVPLTAPMRPPNLVAAALAVIRVEIRELAGSPGLYLFVPLILLQVIASGLNELGPFDTPRLATSGQLAADRMNMLTVLVCMLLLFYTGVSLDREKSCGLDALHGSTPVKRIAVLFAKALVNSLVGVVVLVAAFLGIAVVTLVQGKVGIELTPFLLLWGLLLVPTFVLWCSFVTATHALTGNRYATYGIGLVAFAVTGWCQFKGWMSWPFNWDLWGSIQWSDMSVLELSRSALILNRVEVLGLALLFVVIAVRAAERRSQDAIRMAERWSPLNLLRGALHLAPFAAVPLVIGIVLHVKVQAGFQGDGATKAAKDYWRKNLETYKDAPTPAIRAVSVALDVFPESSSFHAHGSFVLENDEPEPLREILVTPGFAWTNVKFTLNGAEPLIENRAGLRVIRPVAPLAPGARVTLGFEHEATFPNGVTKNGGGAGEFVLPGGVVLTSFGPSFVPMLGFDDGVGVDEENSTDPKVWADDYYLGTTKSVFGVDEPFTTHVEVTVPEGWRANSVGTLTSESTESGRSTFVWESDHPVTFFNVVAGRWSEHKGDGTAIYYHPSHEYNIQEMGTALDAARRRYSEWFRPFPWQELKLSEFPSLATYAQGFATNITFSEGIGFLTQSDEKSQVAFMVTAHEAAHQWWGNMLNPGEGPGGNILSEGMAHFSTILLHESELGLRQRIEFCKQLEVQYGESRQVDSERSMVHCTGTRPGDTTVTYDKGGWVTWMLLNHMGRETMLRALQAFMTKYEKGPDHPVLQDFVADLRPFAPDEQAYDEFTHQWYFEVVVPEYELTNATKSKRDDGRYVVALDVKNKGTGRMPLEIAAIRGERFPEKPADEKTTSEGEDRASTLAGPYLETRTTITVGAGESQRVEILCEFEPETVLVDPDALVLQLNRKKATTKV